MEYIIYCDESIKNGKYFSDFYGGALVRSSDFINVVAKLKEKKEELNLHQEIKWSKVTVNYLDKYKEMMNVFFAFIEKDIVKLRVMFRQNAMVPNLTKEQRDNGFHLLYYQFIKHSFGLMYSANEQNVYLRLYFDKLPDTKVKNELFLSHIFGLQSLASFEKANLKIRRDDIAEVVSHEHVVLQCMDIILGAMAWRLNDGHKEKPEGAFQRGKRTIAKEKLYKHILSLIRKFYPNFNIGINMDNFPIENRWLKPYRHWKFTPRDFTIDESRYK